MYHTFQTRTAAPPPQGKEPPPAAAKAKDPASRRISTTNACLECRRRKIRCDGNSPCSQCQWYHHPESCKYTKPTQRVVPSRALVEKLSTRNAQNESVFAKLFPGRDVESLLSLSREELLDLAHTLPPSSPAESSPSPPHRTPKTEAVSLNSEAAQSLDTLEEAPDHDEDHLLGESQHQLDLSIQRVSDDVNGLSFPVDKQSSYVGASSITAALKVIFKISPGARLFLAQGRPVDAILPTKMETPPSEELDGNAFGLPSPEEGRALLEAYFARIHALMPMIDEQKLWHLWLQGGRKDAPWLALLNTVFALGSLASSDADSDRHETYFSRAMHHINIELLGSGNIMVVQALGLLSGYYLHYVNRPNLANNLMGATIRMATVLGMHKDFAQSSEIKHEGDKAVDSADANPTEIRRRTWWSLFCLDTWAGITNGRPSLGRMGPGVTVRPPRVAMEKMDSARYQEALKMLPLIHNTTYSKISSRIQDTLATSHALDFEEIAALDAELVSWHEDLPSILLPLRQNAISSKTGHSPPDLKRRASNNVSKKLNRSAYRPNGADGPPVDFSAPMEKPRPSDGCPPFLRTARQVMHWRYQNLRIVLHRPTLLAYALRRAPFHSLSNEEKLAISRCRHVAAQTIQDIDTMCEDELIAGWNGVWFMYQAVMVPLVSLFVQLSITASEHKHQLKGVMKAEDPSTPIKLESHPSPRDDNTTEIDSWRSQIATAIRFFERMDRWSVAAKKSRDVIARLFEASERFHLHNKHQADQLAYTSPVSATVPMTPSQMQQRIQQAHIDRARQMSTHMHELQHHMQSPASMSTASTNLPFPETPAGGFMTGFPMTEAANSSGTFLTSNATSQGPILTIPSFPTNNVLATDSDVWNPLPTPATEVPIDTLWQEMQWDTIPTFDADGFNEMKMGVDMSGSVAMDFAHDNGYFGSADGQGLAWHGGITA